IPGKPRRQTGELGRMAEDASLPTLQEAIGLLKGVSTATLTTQLLKHRLVSTWMRGVLPLNAAPVQFVGEAFTLRLLPMREDLMDPDIVKNPEYPQRKVIESCPEGQVLVVDARGVTDVG